TSAASFSTTDVETSTATLTGTQSGASFSTTDIVISTVALTGVSTPITIPFITGIVADDPKLVPVGNFDNGDTITVKFSEPTNQPFKGANNQLTKTNLDSLFSFSQNLGTSYSGKWLTSSTLLITILDSTGGNPTIGDLTLTVKASANLKNALGTSLVSTSTSPPLSGIFGVFTVTIPIVNSTVSTVLPSGTTTQVQLPPNTSGSVTITKSSLSSTGRNSLHLTFVGDVVDIVLPSPLACSNSCDFRFILDQEDLDNANVTLATLRIFHDKDGDGDAADSGETLVPSINFSLPAGPFTVTVKDTSSSNFAVGAVPAAINMIQHVINDNGGHASAADFTLTLSGSQFLETFAGSEQGTPFGLNEGTYSISETVPSGYMFESITGHGCPDSLGEQFDISKGQGITCIITNNDISTMSNCSPPSSEGWTIISSCILVDDAAVLGNVIVQDGAVLTIPAGVTLNMDFTQYNLLIKPGSGVLIKAGGKIS
ncbi:MAG: hypothetical protein ACRD32_06585, partial [Nitrososphaerales archaeon]